MSRIAFNLLFIDAGPLTGPGYYALQLFEFVIHNNLENADKHEVIGYVQRHALHHFSGKSRPYIKALPSLKGRKLRVIFEQVALPFVSAAAQNDLLFSPAFVSPLWGAKRLVATVCDMYYRVMPDATEPFQRKYWGIMIPVTGYRCDRIITISANSKADIERYIPAARGKTVSIPLASRFPVADHAKPSKSPQSYVLMVANLTPNKNCGVVVKAVALLRHKGLNVSFVHAGKDHVGLLEQSVAAHGAGSFVTSRGKVSDEELIDLYQSSLAVVVPSLYEGFGMPAVEAQAMGAPLICSDRAALPEAAGKGALYFDPEDALALADRIEATLALSATEREKIIDAGFDNVRQFSWEKTAHDTMAVFEELLTQ